PGKPRLVTLGFGVDTEQALILKGSWQNARLDSHGSSLQVSAYISRLQQRVLGTADWYFLPLPSRNSLRPVLEFLRHDYQTPYEYLASRGQLGFATSWDTMPLGGTLVLGPSVEFYRVVRGPGAPTSNFLALEARATLTGHDYEYYQQDPRQGLN